MWSQVDDIGSTALHYAYEQDHVNTVTVFLNSGSDIDAVNQKSPTPLHLAAMHGHEDIVKLLLDRGANHGSLSAQLETPLHLRARMGMLDIVEVLIKNGADVNQTEQDGNSILTLAAINGNEALAQRALFYLRRPEGRPSRPCS